MGLIKSQVARGMRSTGFQDLGDLKDQAEKLLREAGEEARAVVAEARERARALEAEAQPRGYEEGRQRGLDEGRAEGRQQGCEQARQELQAQLEQLVSSWTEAVASFDAQRNDLLLAAREEILDLALAMGRKITHRVIEADRTVVTDQVAGALALVTEASAITVSVHPQDKPLVDETLGEVVERIGLSAHVELSVDERVGRGGCVVTTGKGRVDASVDRQVERIVETLLPGAAGRGRNKPTSSGDGP
jgi:flagellar assembly protein FliH